MHYILKVLLLKKVTDISVSKCYCKNYYTFIYQAIECMNTFYPQEDRRHWQLCEKRAVSSKPV